VSGAGIETEAIDVRNAGDAELFVVRDLLDKQLVDRRQDPMGRADGVILTIPAGGGPPRVTWLESGVSVWAARLGRRVGRLARWAGRRWGLSRGRPVRVPWACVVRVGVETELDLVADDTRALAWERWLLTHVVRFIPSLKPAGKNKETEVEAARDRPAAPGGSTIVRGRRIRVQHLLGRRVLDGDGRVAGRIEEVRAVVRGDGVCEVESFEIGRAGLRERLSIGGVSMIVMRALGARGGAAAGGGGGDRIPWGRMDLSDWRRPRVRGRVEELGWGSDE
jgi:sporulation protein YlmC with PRC-barrel domain